MSAFYFGASMISVQFSCEKMVYSNFIYSRLNNNCACRFLACIIDDNASGPL